MIKLAELVKGLSEEYLNRYYDDFVLTLKDQVKGHLSLRGFDHRVIDTTKHDGFYLIVNSAGEPLAKFFLNVQIHKYNLEVRSDTPYVMADIEVQSLRKTKSGRSLRSRDRFEITSPSAVHMTRSIKKIVQDMSERFF